MPWDTSTWHWTTAGRPDPRASMAPSLHTQPDSRTAWQPSRKPSGKSPKDSTTCFKLGIYSDAGDITCGSNDGSLGHEEVDAETFAAWGIDYPNYDDCCVPGNQSDTYKYCPPMTPTLRPNKHCTATSLPSTCATAGYDWKKSETYQRYKAMSQALQKVPTNCTTTDCTKTILFSMSIWGTAEVTSWGHEIGTS